MLKHSQNIANEADQNTLIWHSTLAWLEQIINRIPGKAEAVTLVLTIFTILISIKNQLPQQWIQSYIKDSAGLLRHYITAYGEVGPSYRHFQETFNQHNDARYVVKMRQILQGDEVINEAGDNPVIKSALGVLCATMMLAEPARHPVAMLSALITLDFIQHTVEYGQHHKLYSWNNVLWSDGRKDQYRNGYGAARPPIQWGGKFSMANQGSFDEQLKEPYKPQYNLKDGKHIPDSHQKEGGLLIRWLALQLQKHDQGRPVDKKRNPRVRSSGTLQDNKDVFSNQTSIEQFQAKLAEYKNNPLKRDVITAYTKHMSNISKANQIAAHNRYRNSLSSLSNRSILDQYHYDCAKNEVINNIIKPLIRARLENFDFQLADCPQAAVYE